MLDWLVITADRTDAGRGVQGYALAWFLRTYFGRRRVGVVSPAQFRASPPGPVETIFLGLPSSLTADDIRRTIRPRCRRLAPFDYLDQQQLAWTPEQEPALREAGDRYLKPWFESAWNHGLPMALLPLRTNRRFSAALAVARVRQRFRRRPEPRHDVFFLGRPNQTRTVVDGVVRKLDQRVQWLLELKREAPEISFCGGLVQVEGDEYRDQQARYGDLSDLRYHRDKVGFREYCRLLWQARVLLAPGGNVPWTYRHYECLYAGGVVVSNDFRTRDLLVPLPPEGVVHVPDGAPVLPSVREALELSRRQPEIAQQYVAHLEQYLRGAAYSRRRPKLIERFLRQLG